MSLSYRNQSIDFLCKSFDWFLYERNICVKGLRTRGDNKEPLQISEKKIFAAKVNC